jgi:hypothetical protein
MAVTPGTYPRHITPNAWWYDVKRGQHADGHIQVRKKKGSIWYHLRTENGLQVYPDNTYGHESIHWSDPSSFAVPDSMYNEALAKLYKKISNGIDISEDVFERKQVAKMIDSGERAHTHWRRHLRRWGKTRAITDRYLEFTFGLQPILNTMYDSLDAVRKHRNRKLSFTASCVDDLPFTPQNATMRCYPASFLSTGSTAIFQTSLDGKSGKYGCKIGMTLNRELTPGLNSITSLNPALWAWNALPFSFVADYFWQFGKVLETAEHATLLYPYFLNGYVTHFMFYDRQIKFISPNYNPSIVIDEGYDITGRAVRKVVRRYPLVNPPIPKPPAYRANLGARRLLNIAALFALGLDDSPTHRRRGGNG